MVTVIPALAAALAAAFIYGAGSILQAKGARGASLRCEGRAPVLLIARQPAYVAGLACDFLAWLLTIAALQRMPVFAVQTIVASSLAVTVLLARVFFHTHLRPIDIFAVAGTMLSLILIGFTASSEAAQAPTTAVTIALVVGAPVLVLFTFFASAAASYISSITAGCAFAGSLLSARATHLEDGVLASARNPLTWAVLAYGAVGLISYARALESGNVGSATAITWAAEIVVASLVGRFFLGDHARHGWQWLATVGLVLALMSTLALARSPSQAAP